MQKDVAEILGKMRQGTEIFTDRARPGAWAAVNAAAAAVVVLASVAVSPQAIAQSVEAVHGAPGAVQRDAAVDRRIAQLLQDVGCVAPEAGRTAAPESETGAAAISDREYAHLMRLRTRAILGLLKDAGCFCKDPDAVVESINWPEQARAFRTGEHAEEQYRRWIKEHHTAKCAALGAAAPALAAPGPLGADRVAFAIASAIETEMEMGSLPTGVAAEPGKLTVALMHPQSDARLAVAVKTEGQHAGTVMRYANGKLASFDDDRPAMRFPNGMERHAEPEGVALPASWGYAAAAPEAPVLRRS